MNNLVHPFPCPIYQNFIDKESFLQIKEDTYRFINDNSNLFQQPWFCTTKSTISTPIEKNINNEILKEKIKFHVEEYCKFWDWENPPLVKLESCWVNIAKKGDYQEEHSHSDSLISGVIYINVNEYSGEFQFINSLSAESILLKNPKNFNYGYPVTPLPSLILLFPGWMNHRVLPNNSDIDRISISFNISVKSN